MLDRGWSRVICVAFAVNLPSSLWADDAVAPDDLAFFESKVRPILVENCYGCHSSQAKTLRGGLLLDTKAGWKKGGDNGAPINPGNPDDSLLVQAVRYDDPLMKMPPKGKLSAEAVLILEDWVRRGAPDPRGDAPTLPTAKPARVIDIAAAKATWPFTPLGDDDPPAIDDPTIRNDIDRFLRAKQREKQIAPAPEADRRTLIRRAYFDLIGMPPTAEEAASFIVDETPNSYEHLIDRLLDDFRYGERWARHWLDLARWAESHGFEHDYDRPTAYTYRDFVIRAFNQDLPYDVFVQWQLAGDELAPADPWANMATGFLGAGVHSTQITAATVEKERYDELDDILATTGTAFLGLTIGCARCHDHKFDPIPTLDYYRLLSTFTTTVRTEVDLDLDPEGFAKAKAVFDADHAPYLEALAAFERDELPKRLEAWEGEPGRVGAGSSNGETVPWLILELRKSTSSGGATLTPQADGSVIASGTNPDHETFVFEAEIESTEPIRSIRLEALADPTMTSGGPGRASNGNFALSDFKVTAKPKSSDSITLKLKDAHATFEQPGLPASAAIDDDGTSAWAVDPQFGRDHAAAFALAEPVAFAEGATLSFTLRFTNNLKHAIGRPRISISTSGDAIPLDAVSFPQAVTRLVKIPKAERTPEQSAALLGWFRTTDPDWQRLKAAEATHAASAPKPKVVKAMICSEGLPAVRLHTQGGDFLEKTHVLKRGDPSQKQEVAEPGFLNVLMSEPESSWIASPPEGWRTTFRRAALARWMTDTDKGAGDLLARVIVNRLWQHHFGRGIVATPSDFGAQGEKPTHPELLDWLANRLIEGGWRLKPLHKQMMMSAAYRQSSEVPPEQVALDPDNKWLARRTPHRLEAEAIRDSMIAVSGLLDDTQYGPGTLDPGMKRRSVYYTIKRSKLIPMLTLFDAPDGTVPIAARASTTVAPQSLYLMNSPIVREWAVGFANRISSEQGGSIEASIRRAYQIAFQREPSIEELTDARSFIDQQMAGYQSEGDREALALTDFCQVLLSLNEFVFVE
jgi:Protein of unknown function (DUF1553)/Protein of unknown function (DUF1549)/Planctomycete cytochrome C